MVCSLETPSRRRDWSGPQGHVAIMSPPAERTPCRLLPKKTNGHQLLLTNPLRKTPPMAAIVSPATDAAMLRLSSSLYGSSLASSSRRGVQFGMSIRPSLRTKKQLRFDQSPSCRISFRCSAVTTIGQSEFPAEVLESDGPVLVEFVAEWCGPCRLISPVIEWASQEYKDKLKIVKIDHDATPRLIEEYKVYGLPCLILFKDGKEVPESRREGAITKAKLKEYLDSLLGSTTVV